MRFIKTAAVGLAVVAAMGAAHPVLADARPGVDAWSKGDYANAVKLWRGPAAAGDADAQFNLAQAYKLGRGVPMDLQQAESWYKKAADQGHLQAADNYGLILFTNNRRTEALPYLQESVERGEPRAQYVLGTAHFNGDFVGKDWVRAYALMTRASAQGIDAASRSLTQMDQYIPMDQRQQAVKLAGQMAEQEARNRNAQLAALRTPASNTPVQSAQLPPSSAVPPPAAPAATASAPGVSYDPPPVTTPAPAPTPAPAAPPAAMTTAVVTTAPVDEGWRIQLGAFSQQARAKTLWSQLEGRIGALQSLQPYLVDAGSVTRLQAGPFATKAQAESMCATVKANGNACIVKAK